MQAQTQNQKGQSPCSLAPVHALAFAYSCPWLSSLMLLYFMLGIFVLAVLWELLKIGIHPKAVWNYSANLCMSFLRLQSWSKISIVSRMSGGITAFLGKLLYGVNQKATELQCMGTNSSAGTLTRRVSYNLQALGRFMQRVGIHVKEAWSGWTGRTMLPGLVLRLGQAFFFFFQKHLFYFKNLLAISAASANFHVAASSSLRHESWASWFCITTSVRKVSGQKF